MMTQEQFELLKEYVKAVAKAHARYQVKAIIGNVINDLWATDSELQVNLNKACTTAEDRLWQALVAGENNGNL